MPDSGWQCPHNQSPLPHFLTLQAWDLPFSTELTIVFRFPPFSFFFFLFFYHFNHPWKFANKTFLGVKVFKIDGFLMDSYGKVDDPGGRRDNCPSKKIKRILYSTTECNFFSFRCKKWDFNYKNVFFFRFYSIPNFEITPPPIRERTDRYHWLQ